MLSENTNTLAVFIFETHVPKHGIPLIQNALDPKVFPIYFLNILPLEEKIIYDKLKFQGVLEI